MASAGCTSHPWSDSSVVIVHMDRLVPKNQIVTTLALNRRILCASPDYLAVHRRFNRLRTCSGVDAWW